MWRHLALAALVTVGCSAQARGSEDARIERLIRQLGRDTSGKREEANQALERIGERAVPALVKATQDRDTEVRRRAIALVGRIRSRPDLVVPALLAVIHDAGDDRGDSVKESAILALSYFGSSAEAKKAVPALLGLAEKGSHRGIAMYALFHMRHDTDKIIAFFVRTVKGEKEEQLRARAVYYLGEMGERAKGVSPLLLELLESMAPEDVAIADTLALALGKLGPRDERLAKALTKLCVNGKASINARRQAFIVLGDIGPSARSAVPTLVRCVNNPEYDSLAFEIGKAFRAIGAGAVGPLVENLKKSEGETKIRTLCMLRWVGPPARAALPLLRELAKDRTSGMGRRADEAIRAIDRPKE